MLHTRKRAGKSGTSTLVVICRESERNQNPDATDHGQTLAIPFLPGS